MGYTTGTVETEYERESRSYEDVLDIVWTGHGPRRPARAVQYRSAVFYRTEEERSLAEASKARVESAVGPVSTAIEPLTRFHLAEDYHQKYHWRQFAREWEKRTAGQAPDWRSREFVSWLDARAILACPAGIGAGISQA